MLSLKHIERCVCCPSFAGNGGNAYPNGWVFNHKHERIHHLFDYYAFVMVLEGEVTIAAMRVSGIRLAQVPAFIYSRVFVMITVLHKQTD